MLRAGGLLIDSQPVSARPEVVGANGPLGALDMREWAGVIAAVDERVGDTIAAGLFVAMAERTVVVSDAYDDGPDLLAEVADWLGTRVPRGLADRLAAVRDPVRLHQHVRLRVLRAG